VAFVEFVMYGDALHTVLVIPINKRLITRPGAMHKRAVERWPFLSRQTHRRWKLLHWWLPATRPSTSFYTSSSIPCPLPLYHPIDRKTPVCREHKATPLPKPIRKDHVDFFYVRQVQKPSFLDIVRVLVAILALKLESLDGVGEIKKRCLAGFLRSIRTSTVRGLAAHLHIWFQSSKVSRGNR